MGKKGILGNLFRRGTAETDAEMQETVSENAKVDNKPESKNQPDENIVYLPEVKGALLQLWELWMHTSTPPMIELPLSEFVENREEAMQKLERERVRLIVQIEQDAKRRVREMEKNKDKENFSMNSSCHVYLSKDKMLAWVLFFPPYGPEGEFEGGILGKALQNANVTTGIDSLEVVRLLQAQSYFKLIPIATGTAPIEGTPGEVVELFAREITKEVIVDEDGMADYRAMNYVRQVEENTHICDIIPPKEGTPGVQVDGKIVNPKPVRAARPPKGTNTGLSEDGMHLIATRTGHLEFANDAFHVRALLEIKGDVDYSTGNLDFEGDIHIHGDVREGFEVKASGTVTIDGLVEAATIEAGGDLVISRGVVGDHRAMLRSKGCVRVKYLENCVLYAGKNVYADCIMTSHIFSDDGITVTSGRGSVIGGSLTAAHTIHARMVGAQSGRKTELTLGALPYIQTELQTVEEELAVLRKEISKLDRDLAFMEIVDGGGGTSGKLARTRLRRSVLAMQESKLANKQENLSPIHPDLSKCRFEADTVYPVTSLSVMNRVWVAREVRHRCRLTFDVNNEEIKEVL